MPTRLELSKLSDEHKAMLAQKCVSILMGKVRKPSITETDHASSSIGASEMSLTGQSFGRRSPSAAVGGSGRPRSSSRRGHGRSILAAPPLCIPEVQEKTHAKR